MIADLTTRYGSPPAPEEVFGYIYAVLWDRGFHEKLCDELRQDWPRVSFPPSFEDFAGASREGKRRPERQEDSMGKQAKKLEQMTLTDVLEMFVERISTSLDDVVRRIVREEVAKARKQV